MRYLILGLLLTSCAHRKPIAQSYQEKLMSCMERFSNKGYNAEGIVLICGHAYQERE